MAKNAVRNRRDRWADWAVIGVLAVALLLGLVVKVYAETRTASYTASEVGLTVRYPQGWFLKSDDKLAFQALDPGSGSFKTTYQVRIWPIPAGAEATQAMSSVLNDASLSRAQEGIAYRLFDIVPGDDKDGQPTMESTYVYVVESLDLFTQRMPVVVQGLDFAMVRGETVYVFSLLAAEDAFEGAQKDFRKFVDSAVIQ